MNKFLRILGNVGQKLFLMLSFVVLLSGNFFAQPHAVGSSSGASAAPASTFSSTNNPAVDNAGGTVLPSTSKGIASCKEFMNEVNNDQEQYIKIFEKNTDEQAIRDVLGCGIKTGSIRLWMIPYYIRYILEFIVGIAGLISVGGIVYGGYLYLFAGVSDAKDAGKKAILYGIVGLIMTLVAWAVVNIVIAVVTG